jgi:hypothetical protein
MGDGGTTSPSPASTDDLARADQDEGWDTEGTVPPFTLADGPEDEKNLQLLHPGASPAAPFGLDAPAGWESRPSGGTAVALAAPDTDDRDPLMPLREAERLLSDLCARVEDAEVWEQIRSARDLVREAAAMLR